MTYLQNTRCWIKSNYQEHISLFHSCSLDVAWGDVPCLLGGWGTKMDVRTGEPLDGPEEKWAPDLAVIKATIWFLRKTGGLSLQ